MVVGEHEAASQAHGVRVDHTRAEQAGDDRVGCRAVAGHDVSAVMIGTSIKFLVLY